ncbi:hypothetical protein VHEMI02663 [[Torrubiella] hemipterigena]|uniref:Plastocyanin-like domain-containing protein n=1 Tax=[Torrubiella] hemipterigena TaxID=1531966 RepID=A0A0A1TB66_9HYPO|nr:hypothetical protein VHEMI02663 [[Torrubiella] hemipterigena]
MVHALSFLALVACSTAVQGYFIESNADANTVDVGHFKSMNAFYEHLGTTDADWQDTQVDAPIKREETAGPDSDLAGDGFYNATSSGGTLVPPAVCSIRSPWRDIVCEDMPIHKWQYAHHRPLPIKYTRTRMESSLLGLASSLRAGKDRKMKYRQNGNQRLRPDHDITYDNLKFTVPMSSVHAIEFNKTTTGLMVHMHYIFDREEGHIWYEGATVSLGGHDMLKMEASGTPDYSNITGDVSGIYDYPVHPAATWDYSKCHVWRTLNFS